MLFKFSKYKALRLLLRNLIIKIIIYDYSVIYSETKNITKYSA